MIKYGLISELDARCIEKTLDLICNEFADVVINITEIGLFNCETSIGIRNYLWSKGRENYSIGIDNEKDKPVENWFKLDNVIIGNSNEVYNKLQDQSQHFILIDGDHSYLGVIQDFFAYCDKVKMGGYLCFHDTGKHIQPFKDFQHGDKNNPDSYISVRKALHRVGLLDDYFMNYSTIVFYKQELDNLELIFDEADETNEAGGICVFKKLY